MQKQMKQQQQIQKQKQNQLEQQKLMKDKKPRPSKRQKLEAKQEPLDNRIIYIKINFYCPIKIQNRKTNFRFGFAECASKFDFNFEPKTVVVMFS